MHLHGRRRAFQEGRGEVCRSRGVGVAGWEAPAPSVWVPSGKDSRPSTAAARGPSAPVWHRDWPSVLFGRGRAQPGSVQIGGCARRSPESCRGRWLAGFRWGGYGADSEPHRGGHGGRWEPATVVGPIDVVALFCPASGSDRIQMARIRRRPTVRVTVGQRDLLFRRGYRRGRWTTG